MKRALLLFSAFFILFEAVGQEDTGYPFDLGINITSVLSSFVGNENGIDAADFPLLIRIGRKTKKFRVGLGAISSSKSIEDQITFTTRTSTNIEIASRFGFEVHRKLGDRFGYYWGLDALFLMSDNKVKTRVTSQPFIAEKVLGIGGGPILGLRFKLSKRIYLSTEANIYGVYRIQKRSSSFDPTVTDNSFELVINPPLFLYLNISLGK